MPAPASGVDLDEVVDDGALFQDSARPSFHSPGYVSLGKTPPQNGGGGQSVHNVADGTELDYEYSHTERGAPMANADYSTDVTHTISLKQFVAFRAIRFVAYSLIMSAHVLEFER